VVLVIDMKAHDVAIEGHIRPTLAVLLSTQVLDDLTSIAKMI
jgi:hypothetical protein